MRDPFKDLEAALRGEDTTESSPWVRTDPNRLARTGVPEIVYAERKSTADLVTALRALAAANGRAIASRLTSQHIDELQGFVEKDLVLEIDEDARTAVLSRVDSQQPSGNGTVAIIAAGTSDRAVAREAMIIAREMGCDVIEIHDVGAAGLHRLVTPLRSAISTGIDVIVVAAGMDGALPTVVAGLVDIPVIGLPVSVGYGAGGSGQAALLNMLQSCAPGIAVVNIDNGVGAGTMAGLIARRGKV